mgnify:FL=1
MLEWFLEKYGHFGFDISDLCLDRDGFRQYVWITHRDLPDVKVKLIPQLDQDFSGGLVYISYDEVYRLELDKRIKENFSSILKKPIEPNMKINKFKFA